MTGWCHTLCSIQNSKLKSPINIATDPNLDILVVATEGLSSLKPIIRSLEESKVIALANKESILCGAELIIEKLKMHSGKLIPLDSEPASVKGILSQTNKKPKKIIKQKGLIQITDSGEIENVITKVLSQNIDKVNEYKSGKEKLYGYFIGQIMHETKGKANPQLVNEILKKKLAK
mgnify:CR=1 FL=1